ncbi:hypothetical protein [Pseudomonas sp. DSP3-2-2]
MSEERESLAQAKPQEVAVKSFSICLCAFAWGFGLQASAALLGRLDYLCTIERFSQAEGDSGPIYKIVTEGLIGKQFTIDRATGITVGALKNSTDSVPTVIDPGDTDNSFKVMSSVGVERGMPGTTLTALNVLEYLPGKKKPFVYLINDGVFFGTCESF